MLVSIVIPCYQNEGQLNTTFERIFTTVSRIAEHQFELILMDDGSTDGTWELIRTISKNHLNVSGIRLRKNVGAYNALKAGFEAMKGDATIIMAADGDDAPELIPDLLKLYTYQTDAVLAVRERSEKGAFSILMSGVFYIVLRLVGAKNIFQGGSDFMLVSKEMISKCQSDGWKPGNTLIQLVQHADRVKTISYTKGRSRPSTWSFKKKAALFLQTVNQFISVPAVNSNPKPIDIRETC
ncbi:MAG: glycosyltransferase [Flavobacteriales bacterium]|nr:glycosyltransferase [Flavobacteriales bacterium]MCB9204385.1 glycosyltransferase [Flavobacteriales bacterium]